MRDLVSEKIRNKLMALKYNQHNHEKLKKIEKMEISIGQISEVQQELLKKQEKIPQKQGKKRQKLQKDQDFSSVFQFIEN